jgi:hypothetical protein
VRGQLQVQAIGQRMPKRNRQSARLLQERFVGDDLKDSLIEKAKPPGTDLLRFFAAQELTPLVKLSDLSVSGTSLTDTSIPTLNSFKALASLSIFNFFVAGPWHSLSYGSNEGCRWW